MRCVIKDLGTFRQGFVKVSSSWRHQPVDVGGGRRSPRPAAEVRLKIHKIHRKLAIFAESTVRMGGGVARAASVALSMFFAPITLVGQMVALIFAMAKYPPGTPDRARLVAAHIHERTGTPLPGGAWSVEQLMLRIGADGDCAHLIEAIDDRADSTVRLIPAVTECVVCGTSLKTVTRPSHKRVFSERGELVATVHTKVCKECGANHTMSYAYGGHGLPHPLQRYYPGCTAARWFQSSRDTIYATDLMRRLETQALHSHTGFDTFVREYEMYTGDSMGSYGSQTVCQTFLGWSLLRWYAELGEPPGDVALGDYVNLDATLMQHSAGLLAGFVKKWGTEHAHHCRRPGTCACHIIDGHMKCRRIVCANSRARRIEMGDGLGAAVMGCFKTPVRGSRFCAECRDATARCAGTECVPEHMVETTVEMNPPPDAAAVGDGPPLLISLTMSSLSTTRCVLRMAISCGVSSGFAGRTGPA